MQIEGILDLGDVVKRSRVWHLFVCLFVCLYVCLFVARVAGHTHMHARKQDAAHNKPVCCAQQILTGRKKSLETQSLGKQSLAAAHALSLTPLKHTK